MLRGAMAMLGVMMVPAVGGCGTAVFECAAAEDCVAGGGDGICQPDGYCSFADPACASGQRYGERAPDGIAGACVGVDATTGDTIASTTSTATAASTSTFTSDDTTEDGSTGTTLPMMTSTSESATSSPTTDGMTVSTDSMTGPDREPICGDGVREDPEECEGEDFGGLDCNAFGFMDGFLECEGCTISTQQCSDCAMNCGESCSDQTECSDTQTCVIGAGDLNGSCWPQCMDDAACQMFAMGSACFFLDDGSACLLPCEGNDVCPDGLECTPLPSMELACL